MRAMPSAPAGTDGGAQRERPADQAAREDAYVPSSQQGRRAQAMSPDQERVVAKLQARDAEVRAHEMAHASAGGGLAGSMSFSYQTGPDGRRYAVGGEVSIDVGAERDPKATIAKMQRVRAAALAPAQPSGQDRAVAAAAAAQASQAQAELAQAADKPAADAAPGVQAADPTSDTTTAPAEDAAQATDTAAETAETEPADEASEPAADASEPVPAYPPLLGSADAATATEQAGPIPLLGGGGGGPQRDVTGQVAIGWGPEAGKAADRLGFPTVDQRRGLAAYQRSLPQSPSLFDAAA